MNEEYLWQPWMTLRGATDALLKVIQPASDWLDNAGIDEVRLNIDLQNSTAGATLCLETGPEVSGPWTTLVSYGGGATANVDLVLSSEPKASTRVQRFLRWAIDATGASAEWEATFQLTSKSTRSQGSGNRVSSGDGEGSLQPWKTLISTSYVPQGNDIIISSDENWLDTEGLEKLYIKTQALQCCGATLVLEQAMSPEGPWTTIQAIGPSTNYTVTTANLAIDTGSPNNLERYIRWHLESISGGWSMCFRINAKGWL